MLCIIIAIIFGIITGFFLFKYYKNNNKIFHGPNSSTVKKTIHKIDGKCYIFEPSVFLCPIF